MFFLLLFLSVSLTFDIFIAMCLGVNLLGSSYFKLSGILGLGCLFAYQSRELLSHYFFKYIFASFSLSSPSGTPIMWMLFWLMLSQSYLHILQHFFFFLFAAQFGWVPLPCLPGLWSILLFHLVCWWAPLEYFSVQLLYSSVLWLLFGTLLHFLSLFWSSHCEHLYDYIEFFIR